MSAQTLLTQLTAVWNGQAYPRMQAWRSTPAHVRPYWSEADIVHHLLTDLSVHNSALFQSGSPNQIDDHVDFTVDSDLFTGTLGERLPVFNQKYPGAELDFAITKSSPISSFR